MDNTINFEGFFLLSATFSKFEGTKPEFPKVHTILWVQPSLCYVCIEFLMIWDTHWSVLAVYYEAIDVDAGGGLPTIYYPTTAG